MVQRAFATRADLPSVYDPRGWRVACCTDDRVASKDPKTETLFNEFVDAYSNVNIENAEAFNKTDQESILQAVKDSIGVQQLNDTTRAYCLGQLLPYVAAAGNVEKVNLLLEKGANMNVVKNIPPQYTTTAVGFACAHGHFAVAWLLLKAGADPSVTDQYGTTLLHFAAKYGNVQMCIDLLTKYKLNPNPQPTTRFLTAPGKVNTPDGGSPRSSLCPTATLDFEVPS